MSAVAFTEEIPLPDGGKLYVYRNNTDLSGSFGLDLSADEYEWTPIPVSGPTIFTVQINRSGTVSGGTNPEFNFLHYPLGFDETTGNGGALVQEVYGQAPGTGTVRNFPMGGNVEANIILRSADVRAGVIGAAFLYGAFQLRWSYDVAPSAGATDRIVVAANPVRM